MLWICKKLGLGDDLCHRPVEKILVAHAGTKIEKKDLRCEHLMAILQRIEIVTSREYKFPREEVPKREMIDTVWNILMSADGSLRVMLIGRIVVGEEGHVEVCDLDTRTVDGTHGRVTIHDPQEDYANHMNQENFRNHFWNDEGLILGKVNLEKLTAIIIDHYAIVQHTNQTLPVETGAVNDET